MSSKNPIIYQEKWTKSLLDRFFYASFFVGAGFFFCLGIMFLYFLDLNNHDNTVAMLIGIITSIIGVWYAISQIRETSIIRYTIFQKGFIYPVRFAPIKNKSNYVGYDKIKDISFFNYGYNSNLLLKDGNKIMIREYEGVEPYLLIVNKIIALLDKKDHPDYSMLQKFAESKNREIKKMALREFMKRNEKYLNPPD